MPGFKFNVLMFNCVIWAALAQLGFPISETGRANDLEWVVVRDKVLEMEELGFHVRCFCRKNIY